MIRIKYYARYKVTRKQGFSAIFRKVLKQKSRTSLSKFGQGRSGNLLPARNRRLNYSFSRPVIFVSTSLADLSRTKAYYVPHARSRGQLASLRGSNSRCRNETLATAEKVAGCGQTLPL